MCNEQTPGLYIDTPNISRYNDAYYCTITSITLEPDPDENGKWNATVAFEANGDMSMGALQKPTTSILSVDGKKARYLSASLDTHGPRRIVGELQYAEISAGETLQFLYGATGYGAADYNWPKKSK